MKLIDGKDFTTDAFFGGRFEVFQPARGGHRAGMDSLVLAACIPDGATGKLADLGAGSGVVGIAALTRCPALEGTLVERDATMCRLAAGALALDSNAHIRAQCISLDARCSAKQRRAAGLADNSFDWVLMNPPYNDASHRPSPSELKAVAHKMDDAGLEPWFRTASAILKPKAMVAAILRAENLLDVLKVCQNRFGGVTVVPVQPQIDEAAIRILVIAEKASRKPMRLLPPLIIHEADGAFTQIAKGIFDGERGLAIC